MKKSLCRKCAQNLTGVEHRSHYSTSVCDSCGKVTLCAQVSESKLKDGLISRPSRSERMKGKKNKNKS